MDKNLLKSFSSRPEVKDGIKQELELFNSQSDNTKIHAAKDHLIVRKIAEYVIDDLLEENMALEDENEQLSNNYQKACLELDTFKKQYGDINQDYLQRNDSSSIILKDSKNERKYKKLQQIANKMKETNFGT